MRPVAAVAVLVSVALGTVAVGEVPPTRAPVLDHLLALLGHAPATVRVTSHGPEGQSVREVAWDAFATALAGTSLGGAPGADGPVPASRCAIAGVAGVPCGPDFGQGTLNAGPFCDNSSAWIVYEGAPPGSTFVEYDTYGPPVQLCGGFFGVGYYGNITMSYLVVPEVLLGLHYEGCYATTWTFHSNGYCPNPFSPADSFVVAWQGRGFGAALSFDVEGIVMDYFLGQSAHVAYDLGGCVPDVACVRWAV